jgi:hypothetical protein
MFQGDGAEKRDEQQERAQNDHTGEFIHPKIP